ncbi:hypothetical protein GCM10010245_38570 [Streptomyces spectabilis]|uniref:Uncharacterized protein n=1 Tax=Streptomyces spectabilis TaxID=68270 RepID=A0A7W8AYF7_STRST|nr:hypothetical protein [Streptomyces spectabilis]GGV22995.1 hypothetical protein GCM10010245_38570 [Streptomyces spectabilis]
MREQQTLDAAVRIFGQRGGYRAASIAETAEPVCVTDPFDQLPAFIRQAARTPVVRVHV